MSRVDLKVVLLGSEYVGKTSLLERYVHDRFRGNLPYQNTIGAAYAAKPIESCGKTITLGIWDTAGSERYEAMSRIYYRGAKAAIVCYDIGNRDSWNRAKFWVSELRSCEEDCKIYLCGTKLDVINDGGSTRQVEMEKGRNYAEGIQAKFFETSSKTGHNVGSLFKTIADDYLSNPANLQEIRETISLQNQKTNISCCS